MSQPFADAALELYGRGWHPFPVPKGKKHPPPEGYTGENGVNADTTKVRQWLETQPSSNVATRAPANLIGIDVDQYGEKQGGANLAQFRIDNDLQRLPKTVVSSSKPYPSGIHWFQIGEGCPKLMGAPVSGVELVQRHHRYALMPPSVHPSGDVYRWVDHRTGEILEAAPFADELPWLPWEWIEALTKATIEADARQPIEWEPTVGTEMDARVRKQLDRFDTTPGGRHDMMCEIQMALVRYESLGFDGSTYALQQLRHLFIATVADDRDGGYEFDQALETARSKVAVTESVIVEPVEIELATAEPTEPTEPEEPNKFLRGMLRGRQILDMPKPDPMVGDWLDKGMIFTVVGSFGSAKTFALLDMAMSVTTGAPWLGQPIHHTGPVVYVVAEGGYTIGQRISGWLEARGEDWSFLSDDFCMYPDSVDLLDAGERYDFKEACVRINPSLVIIDTMAQSMPGGDENSSAEMSKMYQAVDSIRKETGASVGFARHTGHNASKRGRGFSGFDDNSDVMLALTGQVKDGPVQLTSQKQKRRTNPEPMWVDLEISALGNPYLVVAAAGPAEASEGGDKIQEAKSLLLSAVRRWRGERPLSRDEWVVRAPGPAKAVLIAAFAELVDVGWFVEVADGLFEPNKEQFPKP